MHPWYEFFLAEAKISQDSLTRSSEGTGLVVGITSSTIAGPKLAMHTANGMNLSA